MIGIKRDLLGWEWTGSSETLSLWITLLLMANEEPKMWKGNEIPRGSFVCTLGALSEQVGISVDQARRNLKRLADFGYISLKATNKWSQITICNYDSYALKKIDDHKQTTNKTENEGKIETFFVQISSENQKNHKQKSVENICESISYKGRLTRDHKQTTNKPQTNHKQNDFKEKEKVTQREKENNSLEEHSSSNILSSYINKINSKESRQRKDLIKESEPQKINSIAEEITKTICRTKTEFDLSFVREDLRGMFEEFLAMRRKIRKPLKTMIGVKARYNTLVKLSGGNAEQARKIVNQTLEHEWQDFYALHQAEPKTTTTYKNDKYW